MYHKTSLGVCAHYVERFADLDGNVPEAGDHWCRMNWDRIEWNPDLWQEHVEQAVRATVRAEQSVAGWRRESGPCKHIRTKRSDERGFTHSVAIEPHTHENRSAHGGIEVIETCEDCGASRPVLINGPHFEFGPWTLLSQRKRTTMTTCWGERHGVRADWSESSCTIESLSAEGDWISTQYIVANFRHSDTAALERILIETGRVDLDMSDSTAVARMESEVQEAVDRATRTEDRDNG